MSGTAHTTLTRDELRSRLARLPAVLAGREPDATGAVRGVLLAVGAAVLLKVQDNYQVQAQGGAGTLGTGPWEPLSAVTLALRRKDPAQKVVDKLRAEIGKLPAYRQRLVAVQFNRAYRLYRADELGDVSARRARLRARKILERMRPSISATRYKQLAGELARDQKVSRAVRLAVAAAHAEILRDTGRLFNSLSPSLRGEGDNVLRTEPGVVVVGTNVDYAKYHQSGRPRKLRKDGRPVLPRRQFLPDAARPMPPEWREAALGALRSGLASADFWRTYLER